MPHSSRDFPLISDRSPTYGRAVQDWGDELASADGQTVGTFSRLIELERDLIAALLAARNRLEPRTEKSHLDELLAEHAARLPVLERHIRDLGGLPPDPGERAHMLPRDAADITVMTDERDVQRAVAADHEALAERYREALSYPHHHDEARRVLESYSGEMEHEATRLTALVAPA